MVNILECSTVEISTASSAGCSFANAAILHPDPTGSGSVVLHIGTGTIGNGVCDAAHSCYVVVNNASSTNPADTKALYHPLRLLTMCSAIRLGGHGSQAAAVATKSALNISAISGT